MVRPRRTVLLAVLTMLVVTAHAAATSGSAPVQVEVVQTTINLSQAMTRLPNAQFGTKQPPRYLTKINVDPNVTYQSIHGFGGALTDTSAYEIWDQASPAARDELLDNLFARSGLHLNFIRVPMGATDFTRTETPYSYDDMPPGKSDPHLTHFSIAHDQAYIIPMLRQMLAIDPQMELLANPWSPPGWMKSNDSLGNVHDTGYLLVRDYGPLAQYFVKFIQAYAAAGVPIDAITPQNEPSTPTIYPGLNFSESSEAHFIRSYLQPALSAAKLHVNIYGNDLGLSPGSVDYARGLPKSSAAGDLHGIAWHCYHGSPDAITAEHDLYPRLDEIMDECSPGLTSSITETVISSLRNWASAVVFFNLALDPERGPVQPPNHGCPPCSAESTVYTNGTYGLNINFYQLAQASHFIEPGAVRISAENFVSYNIAGNDPQISTPGLDDVAVKNPNGSIVLIAYNNSAKPIRFAVEWHNRWIEHKLGAETTVTFEWDKPA